MKISAPPRDWFSTAAGLTAAVALAAGLAWLVFGPSATRPVSPWQLVWVNIVAPSRPQPQPPRPHGARIVISVPPPGHP